MGIRLALKRSIPYYSLTQVGQAKFKGQTTTILRDLKNVLNKKYMP